jgi:hypothetical protein
VVHGGTGAYPTAATPSRAHAHARVGALLLCPPPRRPRTVQAAPHGRLEIGACLGVTRIGKPCTGEPYARFDEGGLASCGYDSAIEAPPNERGGNR